MLSAVVVLALLIAWIVTSGGGGGKKGADGSNGKNPVSTITPGPSGSGPAISQAPGGRDESSGGGSGSGSGGGAGAGSGTGDGSSGGTGGGSTSGSSGSAGSAGSSAGSGGDVTSGSGGTVASLPGSSALPNCTAGAVQLTLKSLHNSYSPEQTPTFELAAKNTSSSDCKIDLGPKNAVLTITASSADNSYWSSADCPKTAGNRWYRVPAGSSITYTLKWDRKPSAAQCATPPAGSAGAGTYLLQAAVPGYPKAQASFVLSAD